MSDPTTAATSTTPTPVAQWLLDRIRFYDQVEPEIIALDAPLRELGLDSIYALTLCGDIEDTYGLPIDPTYLGGFETLGDLAEDLSARVDAK